MTISDPVALIILFGVGIIAGFINVTAGGGSTLTLPVLMFKLIFSQMILAL